tara:strand:+ start:4536 stop:4895 length:360 start_codon:yes stop_codon:yes gene_type:complete
MVYEELRSKILEASVKFAESMNLEYNELHQSMLLNAMDEVNHQITKVTLLKEFENGEKEALSDILFELTNIEPTEDVIVNTYRNLPEDLKADGVRWGFCDSDVRDNIYSHLKEKLEKNS